MAVRVREDGEIVCAAMHPAQPGDYYIDDGFHYLLSVELHALVTDADHLDRPGFKGHGLWWWIDEVPEGIEIDRWWEP